MKHLASKCALFFSFLLIGLPIAKAQTWQELYDQAQTFYQEGDYTSSYQKAIEALDKAQGNEFAKPRAFTLQLVTTAGLDAEAYAVVRQYAPLEIAAFQNLKEENEEALYQAYLKEINAYLYNGLSEGLEAKFQSLVQFSLAQWGDAHALTLGTQLQYGEFLSSLGQADKAIEVLAPTLPKAKSLPELSEDYFYNSYALGASYYATKDKEKAISTLEQFLKMAELNNMQSSEEYKQSQRMVAELKSEDATAEEKLALAKNLDAKDQAKEFLETALLMEKNGEYLKALEMMTMAESMLNSDTAASASLLHFSLYFNQARLLTQVGHWQEADKALNTAQAYAQKVADEQAQEWLYLYTLWGTWASQKEDAALAENQFAKAHTYLANANQSATYYYFNERMLAFFGQHQLKKASQFLLDNETTIAAKLSLEQRAKMGFYQADIAMELGNMELAQKTIEKYQALLAKEITHYRYDFSLLAIDLNLMQGKYPQALEQAVKLIAQAPDALVNQEAYLLKAKAEEKLALYADAEASFKKALSMNTDRSEAIDIIQEATNSLGTFYLSLGNYAAAERYFTETLANTPENLPFYTTLQQNLATVYQLTNRYDKAIPLLEKVKANDKETLGSLHTQYAITLQNLASAYVKVGEIKKAQALYEEALAIDAQVYGKNHLSYANKLSNLGVLYQEQNELNKASQLLSEALRIRKAQLGSQHPDYAFSVYNLAVLKQRMKRMDEAAPLFKEAISIYLFQINSIFPALSEQEKTVFYNKIKPIITAYQDFAVEYGSTHPEVLGDLFTFRLATKALLMTSTAKVRRSIMASTDQSLKQNYLSFIATKEELAQLYTLSLSELQDKKEYIQQLEDKANTLEKELSKKSVAFSAQFSQEAPIWENIKGSLQAHEAAVELIRLKLNVAQDTVIYAGLVVDASSAHPTLVVLPDGNRMEQKEFKSYINSIKFKLENPRAFDRYWGPFDTKLAGKTTIYLSTDGIYNKINIATLMNPGKGQYVVDYQQIRLLSNLRELLEAPEVPSSTQNHAVLMGYPNFGGEQEEKSIDYAAIVQSVSQENPDNFGLTRGGISPLPGTKTEIEGISTLLKTTQWKTETYLAEQANEAQIKSTHNPAVLHIATHGFFIENTSEKTDWVYSTDVKDGKNNPLLRSGILLSGAAESIAKQLQNEPLQGQEDGILTAYEAMNLSLDHTQLVVLSACETGSGEVSNGEGVYGLQRAFKVSGAQNVLMSLWKVDDSATQQLMNAFYTNWMASGNKHEALRKAQIDLQQKYPDPYYWGAFVMIGN
ncbi:CHAT domain-containing protein [Cytophagales bacterium LB-30]|uniref:CHAT domain-containing protein n=1 Tax=Shiella aurantiaca TaxID=3058365 RepID=A0ABT8F738_9BACT|nr:CHAT domain-containing tetratricopeptide repeat protein [Shiella aurantiaca]MDN4166098.1 CHAT domain-containing protein [Shiella aurantiaca]